VLLGRDDVLADASDGDLVAFGDEDDVWLSEEGRTLMYLR
jgi:hypothetical protein